jgi:hypothetical protein
MNFATWSAFYANLERVCFLPSVAREVDRGRSIVGWRMLGMELVDVAHIRPPHPGFFLGHGMEPPPKPDIWTVPSRKIAR